MKKFFLLICFAIVSSSLFSQTAFRKRYYFKDTVFIKKADTDAGKGVRTLKTIKDGSDAIYIVLQSDTTINKVNKKYSTKITTVKSIPTEEKILVIDTLQKTIGQNDALNEKYSAYSASNCPKHLKANVKFTDGKLYVNPWFIDTITQGKNYYYKLKNRQRVKLHYQQVTFTALTVPLKVQFGKDSSVNYQTGISIGALFGYSWGNTKFTRRSDIGNFERSHEFTIGGLLNVAPIEFKDKYKRDVKTGSLGTGIGLLYSYNSITAGLSFGVDFALGSQSSHWNFDGKPWLGIMIGYSLFDK